MEKIDFKQQLKRLYRPSLKVVEMVDVPDLNFLMIDGQGDPNTSQAFGDAVEALFSVAYALKFIIKKSELQIDYGVMPLEALWWADDMSQFSVNDKAQWRWTAMIMQPELVTEERYLAALDQVSKKKELVALPKIRFELFSEKRVAQTMHIGPFSEEGPTVKRVHDFIRENGYARVGKHHEVYLSDIRRAAPEKWKTVIRHPVKGKSQALTFCQHS